MLLGTACSMWVAASRSQRSKSNQFDMPADTLSTMCSVKKDIVYWDLQESGSDVSPWHDLPLYNEDGTLTFFCEITQDTTAKFEVATVCGLALQGLTCFLTIVDHILSKHTFMADSRRFLLSSIKAFVPTGGVQQPCQAGRDQGSRAAALPQPHALELRHAAANLGGPRSIQQCPAGHWGMHCIWSDPDADAAES